MAVGPFEVALKTLENGDVVMTVNGERRAFLRLTSDGRPQIHWEVHGGLPWTECQPMLLGLLELGMKADQQQHIWENRVRGKKGR